MIELFSTILRQFLLAGLYLTKENLDRCISVVHGSRNLSLFSKIQHPFRRIIRPKKILFEEGNTLLLELSYFQVNIWKKNLHLGGFTRSKKGE